MIIKLHPAETLAAIAQYVQAKTGIKVTASQVSIWHDPNDAELDSLNGVGVEVSLENMEESIR